MFRLTDRSIGLEFREEKSTHEIFNESKLVLFFRPLIEQVRLIRLFVLVLGFSKNANIVRTFGEYELTLKGRIRVLLLVTRGCPWRTRFSERRNVVIYY